MKYISRIVHIVFHTSVLTLILGVGIGLFIASTIMKKDVRPPIYPISNTYTDEMPPPRFLSDEVLLIGTDARGRDFVLNIDFNRKEISPNSFVHYYDVVMLFSGKTKKDYYEFFDPLYNVIGDKGEGFLKKFKNDLFPDLSARETFSFNVTIDDREITVSLTGLTGDFITKNRMLYTKYASVGKAKVTIDGQSFTTNALILKMYSDDYRKYVFFDGFDDLNSTTQVFALWDENDNFYFIDNSDVVSSHENYKSHSWVLYKDGKTGATKKAFKIDIDTVLKRKIPDRWEITIPDFNTTISAEVDKLIDKREVYGLVQGMVTDANGSRSIKGLFDYSRYRRSR